MMALGIGKIRDCIEPDILDGVQSPQGTAIPIKRNNHELIVGTQLNQLVDHCNPPHPNAECGSQIADSKPEKNSAIRISEIRQIVLFIRVPNGPCPGDACHPCHCLFQLSIRSR